MGPVRIYSTEWCSDCRRAKQFLKERGVQLEEINIDESPDAEDLVLRVTTAGVKCQRLTSMASSLHAAHSIRIFWRKNSACR